MTALQLAFCLIRPQDKFCGKILPVPQLIPYRDWRKMQIREIKRMPVVNLVTDPGFESALGDEWRIHTLDNHDDASPQGDPGPIGHRSSKADQGKWSYLFDGLNPNDDPLRP